MSMKYWIPFTKKLSKSEQEYYNHLLNCLNKELIKTSKWLSSKEAKELFKYHAEELEQYLLTSNLLNELDLIINSNAESSEEYIQLFYEQGAKKGCKDIKRKLHFTHADEEALYLLKNYNFNLIKDLGEDMKDLIREYLTSAIIEEKGVSEIREKLQQLPLTPVNNHVSPDSRARMIARTEYSRARVNGTLQSYNDYGVDSVDILDAGDSLVCDDCLDKVAENPHNLNSPASEFPPYHPNCRCTVTAHTGFVLKEPLENPSRISLVP